jgi:hypothetical protein
MKSVCGLIFALFLVAAHADEKAVLDFEFRQAAVEGKVSVQEMLRRLQIATPHLAEPAADSGLYFTEIYAIATKKANDAELVELEEMLRAMPADALEFDDCFSAYATLRIRRRVAEIAKKPVDLEWQLTTEPLPKELADAPESFRDAWELYHSVLAPYLAVVEPPEKADPPKKTPALDVDLRKVMGKPEPGAWEDLAEHIWEVGAGSDLFYHPRNRALLLSLLADGKLAEAAGAALGQVPSMSSPSDQMDSVTIDLLAALGVDWEQVMFGSLLPPGTSYSSTGSGPVVVSGFRESDAWRLLAARGSDRAVRQCLELIRWARLKSWSAGDFLSVALGPVPSRPSDEAIPIDPWEAARPVRTMALPPGTRREIISVFAGYLAPTNNPADLLQSMQRVPAHCVKDLREPLAALLSHRAHTVAAKALEMLKDAGLTTGQEKITPSAPPLRFRLLLNGEPLVGEKISVIAHLVPNASDGKPFFYWLAPSQDLIPGADGWISYSLEECLEPERIGSVQFRAGPPLVSTELNAETLLVSPEDERRHRKNEWLGPWFVRQIEARAGDERVRDIELRVADIEVKLTAFDKMTPKSPVEIFLRRSPLRTTGDEVGVARVKTDLGSGAFFRRLQPGQYTLVVKAPGAARYESKEITLGDTAVMHEVRLEPGRVVRGTAVFPDGQKLDLVLVAQLFRDGLEIPRWESDDWKSLPFGKYTARVASTREYEEGAKKDGAPVDKIAPEDRIDSIAVSFVIDASTPATLDLGEVVVPRERR